MDLFTQGSQSRICKYFRQDLIKLGWYDNADTRNSKKKEYNNKYKSKKKSKIDEYGFTK